MMPSVTLGWVVIAGLVLIFLVLIARAYGNRSEKTPPRETLLRAKENPLLTPIEKDPWESTAVFNPAAVLIDGKIRLFYRALGHDGISRIGYAESDDGLHFRRFSEPAFVMRTPEATRFKNPFKEEYNPDLYASGGGWGGSEDPRVVLIEGRLYMTFGSFESWESLRIALTSLSAEKLDEKKWEWANYFFVSPPGEANKNWVMFPEKIHGKFAMLHALTPKILIDYANSPVEWGERYIKSNNHRTGRVGHWDGFVRGAAAPPLKTRYGWLLLYHAMDPSGGPGYKVGAMLLDLDDPTQILYRSDNPILEPKEWYENDWKPGVVYASGAVIKDETLFVYYGGGDKTVNVASAPLEEFLKQLMKESV